MLRDCGDRSGIWFPHRAVGFCVAAGFSPQTPRSACGRRLQPALCGLKPAPTQNISLAHSGISFRTRDGSSPSHSGCVAVESKIDVVLNNSNSPREAAPAVFARSALTCDLLIGLNVR